MLERLEQLRTAIELRSPLRMVETDALRLVDGSVDGFPDLEVDDFAGRWLVQTRDRRLPDGFADACMDFGARSVYWKRLDQGDKQAPRHMVGEVVDERFEIRENGLRYLIDFAAGYSQGIFLDQRSNRARVRELATGRKVLNTFAYTCVFGVAAAAGGAEELVNLDLSKNYLAWGRENFALNGLDDERADFIFGDAFDWLGRFAKRGRLFDMVILDPPTFSRDAKGRVFTVRDGYGALLEAAARVLAPGGILVASTNFRALDPDGFRRLVRGVLGDRCGKVESGEMPADFRGESYLKSAIVTVR